MFKWEVNIKAVREDVLIQRVLLRCVATKRFA